MSNRPVITYLVDRDGSRLRIVPDENRAFGSGMSAFGDVTQRTKPTSVGSINNIALHVSLVSPADGRDDRDGHSGYTNAQYKTSLDKCCYGRRPLGSQ